MTATCAACLNAKLILHRVGARVAGVMNFIGFVGNFRHGPVGLGLPRFGVAFGLPEPCAVDEPLPAKVPIVRGDE